MYKAVHFTQKKHNKYQALLMTAYEPDTAVQGCTFSFRHLDQSCISKCKCSAGATSISKMQPGTNTYLIRLDIFLC